MAAMKTYFIEGLVFLLLTLGLFVLAATGQGRDYTDLPMVRLSDFEVFLPFFAWMLAFAGLGAVLGLMQAYVVLPNRWKFVNALAFGVGVLGYVFGYYWKARRMTTDDLANPLSWPVFLSGSVLILSLVVNVVGVARFQLGRK